MFQAPVPNLTGKERIFTLDLPLREKVNKRAYEAINLNIYRNQHHYKRNNQKKAFHERMEKPIKKLPNLGKIWLHYEIYPKTRRRLDTMNPGSVIDKFFSDSLVEHGVLTDDNYDYVVFNSFCVVEVDKVNPRCTVTIIELEESEDMKLSMTANLSSDDIKEAIAAWLSDQTSQECNVSDIVLSTEDVTAVAQLGDETEEPTAPTEEKPKAKRTRRTKAQIAADKEKKAAENEPDTDEDVPSSSGSDGGGSDSAGEDETVSEEAVEEAEVVSETPAKAEGKKSKNLFEDTPEKSSKASDKAETEDAGETPPVKKKPSIFDT